MRMTKGVERPCWDWWLICTFTACVVHRIVYCFCDITRMPTLSCSSYVHVWCRYMPQILSEIDWTITPCNYYPSAIFRRCMLMNEAYYVSLEPSLRSMYSLSRRWSIAFLISGTFGVNLVLESAWRASFCKIAYRDLCGDLLNQCLMLESLLISPAP